MSNDHIKGMFASGGKLYLVTDAGLAAITANKLEPADWPQERFSGPIDELPEQFRAFFFREASQLAGFCTIYGQRRDDLLQALHVLVLDGLMRAFAELQTIRSDNGKSLPRLERERPYENFSSRLWHTYRHLWPDIAKHLGYDKLGFLFNADDAKFEKGAADFAAKHGCYMKWDICKFVRNQRSSWQQELCKFRNDYLEHRKQDVANDAAWLAEFYKPETAEALFDAVWRTIADLTAALIESRMLEHTSIRGRPAEAQSPNYPQMWEVYFQQPVARPKFSGESEPR